MESGNNYHIHISAKHKLFDLKLRETWQYRDLIKLFTLKNFTVRYKQTILGPLWFFLNPIISAVMYTIVFGNIAKLSTDGLPKVLFYLAGTAIWNYFSTCVTTNASVFLNNASLFGKVYFPRLAIPVSYVLSNIVQFLIQFLLVLVFLGYYVFKGVVHPNYIGWLLIPVVIIQLGIMGMGFGIIVSSFTTKYRDLSVLVGFGMQLWMYATPVVYPVSQLAGNPVLKQILYLNPVTAPVELFRYALLGVGSIDPKYIALSWAFTILVAIFGIVAFNKTERTFIDIV